MPGRAVRIATRPVSIAVTLAASAALATAWMLFADDDSQDLAGTLTEVHWLSFAAILTLLLIAAVHYLSAAIALRGVSNRPLPLVEATSSQLAAATMNRIVPNGFGGAAVNVRYLSRSGLTPGAATSALAALALLGGLTDAVYVAVVTTLGPALGMGGATQELHTLSQAGVAAGQSHTWLLAAVVTVLVVVLLVRTRGRLFRVVTAAARHATVHARDLVLQPRRLGVAAGASTMTTAILSAGFVLAVEVWGQAAHPLHVSALIAVYWIAVAANDAAPLPAFLGLTEAAMIAALVLSGYSAGSATVAVLAFRLITFWLPMPFGVLASRRLRRAQLL
jgi:uncharacterized membrane protein YbhN (UPF0104 family)